MRLAKLTTAKGVEIEVEIKGAYTLSTNYGARVDVAAAGVAYAPIYELLVINGVVEDGPLKGATLVLKGSVGDVGMAAVDAAAKARHNR